MASVALDWDPFADPADVVAAVNDRGQHGEASARRRGGGGAAEPAPAAAPAAALELRVSTLGGATCSLLADRSWTVAEAKASLERILAVPRCEQRLLLGSEQLADGALLDTLPQGDSVGLSLVRCRAGPDYWLTRVQACGLQLGVAPPDVRADRTVVLAAVAQHGSALRFAETSLREDAELVATAVRQDGCALAYAAPALQADPEIVRAALRQNGLALQSASAELRADRAVVLLAMRQCGRAVLMAERSLWDDEEVIAALGHDTGMLRILRNLPVGYR